MRVLLASELRRFRRPIAAAAVAHALLLAALAVVDDVFVPSPARLALAAMACALGGLLLGVYQMRSYRRGDLWAFLLHRPLPAHRIFLALAVAAATLLAIAVLLPLLFAVAFAALGSAGVDPRHLLLAPYAWGTALAFYLAGCLIALTPWRGAVLAAAPALLTLAPAPLGAWVFLPLALVIVWLGWLAAAAMRPDPSAPPRSPLLTAAAALPALHVLFLTLSFSLLFAYSVQVAIGEKGVRGFTRFAWNDQFPAGSYPRTGYLAAAAALAHGLEAGTPAARRFATQLAALPVTEISPHFTAFPRRRQPAFLDRHAVLEEKPADRRWTFRHDRMELVGSDLRSGAPAALLDVAREPIDAVPHLVGGVQLVTPRRSYRFDGSSLRVVRRLTLAAGERFLAPPATSPMVDLALSDQALYLFAAGELLATTPLPAPLAVVPLGGEAGDLDRALVAPLRDGHLVSFLFGRRSERELGVARQVVLWIGADSRREVLTDVSLAPGLPAWVRHRGVIVSPALQALDDLVRSALYGPGPRTARPGELLAHPPPRGVFAGALLVAVLAAAATWLLAGRRGLGARSRRAWTAAALLLGLPVPCALLLFTAPPS